MKIKICRNCKNNKFHNLFSLGKMSFTGRFPKSIYHNVPKAYLNLLMCKKFNLFNWIETLILNIYMAKVTAIEPALIKQ